MEEADLLFSESDDEFPSRLARGCHTCTCTWCRSAVQPATDDNPDPPSQDEPAYPAEIWVVHKPQQKSS